MLMAKIFFCPINGYQGVGGLKNTERAPIEKNISVKVPNLDDYIKKYEITKLDFIKIDIDGGELDVFNRAEYTLNNIRPIILFETNELNTEHYGYRVFDILLFLEEREYIVKKSWAENFLTIPRCNN